MTVIGLGVGLTAALTIVAVLAWGGAASIGVMSFGLVGTAVQAAASAMVRPAVGKAFPELMKRWGLGIALRLAGVVVLGAAIWLDGELFRPLPSALGYIGVLFPLMIVETRRLG